jgi:hypothetical protein
MSLHRFYQPDWYVADRRRFVISRLLPLEIARVRRDPAACGIAMHSTFPPYPDAARDGATDRNRGFDSCNLHQTTT